MDSMVVSLAMEAPNRQMLLMAQARQAATFDPEKLTIVIYDEYVPRLLAE